MCSPGGPLPTVGCSLARLGCRGPCPRPPIVQRPCAQPEASNAVSWPGTSWKEGHLPTCPKALPGLAQGTSLRHLLLFPGPRLSCPQLSGTWVVVRLRSPQGARPPRASELRLPFRSRAAGPGLEPCMDICWPARGWELRTRGSAPSTHTSPVASSHPTAEDHPCSPESPRGLRGRASRGRVAEGGCVPGGTPALRAGLSLQATHRPPTS